MSEFVKLTTLANLPAEGEAKSFELDGALLCVSRVNGRIGVIEGRCPHRGAPLGTGTIEGGHLICPYHNWEFDPFTGEGYGLSDGDIGAYEVKIERRAVYIRRKEKE
jgi:nitrite reductase/ring-hydroxylating ferredoxin subunit